MPCNSDYMEATNQEVEASKVMALLEETETGVLPEYYGNGYYKEVYGKVVKTFLDEMVAKLCTTLKKVDDITKYSLEMQIWWRDHQKADNTVLIKKQLAFLDDTRKYYDSPEKFCISETGGGCKYNPKNAGKEGKSEGCAIGRHLPEDLQEAFDNALSIGSTIVQDIHRYKPELYAKMPEKLRELGLDFLQKVQTWHDAKALRGEDNFEELRQKVIKGDFLWKE